MGKLRSLSTSFWSDPFIEELTPSEKLLYIYFITNEKTNMLGIYEVSIKKICFETGLSKDVVLKAFETFQKNNKIKYQHNFIILVNFIKHQNYNPNMKKAAIQTYLELPKELKINDLVIDESNSLKAFETLSNHLGMVRKYEYELEEEYKDEKEVKIEKSIDNSLSNIQTIFISKTENIWNREFILKESEKFFNYYSSNFWMVGKNKMKSVEHAVAGWILRVDKPVLKNAPKPFDPSKVIW